MYFWKPFSVKVSDAPEKLQLDLTELYMSHLHSSFRQEAFITVCASLSVPQLSELCTFVKIMESVLGKSYTYEQAL
jgi:hypothetical protein